MLFPFLPLVLIQYELLTKLMHGMKEYIQYEIREKEYTKVNTNNNSRFICLIGALEAVRLVDRNQFRF